MPTLERGGLVMVKMNFMENEGLSINVWLFRRIFIFSVSFSIYIIEKYSIVLLLQKN